MRNIKTFFMTPTNLVRQYLDIYMPGNAGCDHPQGIGYHTACVAIADIEIPGSEKEDREDEDYGPLETNTHTVVDGMIGPVAVDDPRWPTQCVCGFKFPAHAVKSYAPRQLYRRSDNQALITMRFAPIGAMWYTRYLGHTGPDGKTLVVRIVTKHDWIVDGRASNCDSPCKHCGVPYHRHKNVKCSNPGHPDRLWTIGSYEDSKPNHRCWVRHGDPTTGDVHVDKNGETCGAGGGSIQVENYHGFLHHGYLTDCP